MIKVSTMEERELCKKIRGLTESYREQCNLDFSLGGAEAMVIDGIRVEADSSLSRDQICELIRDFTKTWAWEGKQLGRIELSQAGQSIAVRIYDRPYTTTVPLNNIRGGVMP